jgi:hypothetical protein
LKKKDYSSPRPFPWKSVVQERTKWRDGVSWRNCFPCPFSALPRRPSDQEETFEDHDEERLGIR